LPLEKEGKTLETLLSMPVKRSHILAGKIFGVIVIALIATMAYFGGYMYYMNTILSEIPMQGFSFTVSPTGIGLVGITLFLTLLSGLSLAMLLAVMCEDVRSAQSFMGVIYIPINHSNVYNYDDGCIFPPNCTENLRSRDTFFLSHDCGESALYWKLLLCTDRNSISCYIHRDNNLRGGPIV